MNCIKGDKVQTRHGKRGTITKMLQFGGAVVQWDDERKPQIVEVYTLMPAKPLGIVLAYGGRVR